jgi:catechol 2,3-dioxygenase-like lactoylglutathione lyase family enzyme
MRLRLLAFAAIFLLSHATETCTATSARLAKQLSFQDSAQLQLLGRLDQTRDDTDPAGGKILEDAVMGQRDPTQLRAEADIMVWHAMEGGTVGLMDIAYIILNRTDIKAAKAFFSSMGLTIASDQGKSVYFRCYDDTHHAVEIHKAENDAFVGMGFTVSERRHLHDLNKAISSATLYKSAVGGGERVVFIGPDGVQIEVRYDMKEGPDREADPQRLLNYAMQHTRPLNSRQKVAGDGPAQPWRLGHVVIRTQGGHSELSECCVLA